MVQRSVSQSALQRLPKYFSYLKALPRGEPNNISATTIALALDMGEVQVRKDLASVCEGGKPKVGYNVPELLAALEEYLGYNDIDDAVIVGAGKLGKALLDYDGFNEYGVNIVAAFDNDENNVGMTKCGKQIFSMRKFPNICERMQVHIGIIAVPDDEAQSVCDEMVANGITAILNYAPTHLKTPKNVILQNENLAASMAILTRKLKELQFSANNV